MPKALQQLEVNDPDDIDSSNINVSNLGSYIALMEEQIDKILGFSLVNEEENVGKKLI